jgi:hypothetical protein
MLKSAITQRPSISAVVSLCTTLWLTLSQQQHRATNAVTGLTHCQSRGIAEPVRDRYTTVDSEAYRAAGSDFGLTCFNRPVTAVSVRRRCVTAGVTQQTQAGG